MKGINKIKIVIVGLFVMLPSLCLFSEDALFDFDGKDLKGQSNSISLVNEKLPASPKPSKKEKRLPDVTLRILDENGQLSVLKPTSTYIDENGNRTNYYEIQPNWAAEWYVWCSGNGEWTAKKTYSYCHDKYGGHYHYFPPAPLLKYAGFFETSQWPSIEDFHETQSPIYFPTMEGNNKRYYYYIWYPEFALKVTDWLESYGVCNGMITSVMSVKIPGDLEELGHGNYYVLVGTTTSHPYNHYLQSDVIDKMKKIAEDFHKEYPKKASLKYNDFSLPWGGLFDIGPEGGCTYDYDGDGVANEPCRFWSKPHSTHRYGYNADVSYWLADWAWIPNDPAMYQALEKIFKNNGARVLREDKKKHWHLDFTPKSSKYYEEELKCY
jgi:hypothetical protein